ncbi:YALIA101S03e07800g1_1 [Yarrowia lipolytica]|jgi:hypothetical protein|nr:hypothetical protein BD777DRAFT_122735 [Yarrowia lipolytica]SEI32996.1 YALIA101S03e07800g1_1 [Yarrowia lipolytica]VBB82493.1 Hypothetical protein conserved in the Yarrowia clade [Yarrowia lipolytica]
MSWIDRELEEFTKEYTPFVKHVTVENGGSLKIESLEGKYITASVTEDGWTDQNGQRYPTSQALLSANSPEFVHKWHDQLFTALSRVKDDQK